MSATNGLIWSPAVLPVAFVFMLAGCETTAQQQPIWQTPPGGTQSQVNRAFYECKRDSMTPLIRDYKSNLVVLHPVPNWQMVNKCMAGRGYRLKVAQ